MHNSASDNQILTQTSKESNPTICKFDTFFRPEILELSVAQQSYKKTCFEVSKKHAGLSDQRKSLNIIGIKSIQKESKNDQ